IRHQVQTRWLRRRLQAALATLEVFSRLTRSSNTIPVRPVVDRCAWLGELPGVWRCSPGREGGERATARWLLTGENGRSNERLHGFARGERSTACRPQSRRWSTTQKWLDEPGLPGDGSP